MSFSFKGQRAVVTGAGKGIGREITLQLAKAGAEVVAISRTAADLASLQKETKCQVITADLGDPVAAKKAAEEAGDFTLLVNNAGISIPESLLATTPEHFLETYRINVLAGLVMAQVMAKKLAGKKGAIVNVSSQASMIGLRDHAAYCASKGALDQLTRVMALELGPVGLRVNAVNPTVTLTPMGAMAWGDPAKRDPMLAKIPLGRFAEPSEVADAVLFLLSDKAAMIHGVMLPVDGGFLAT
jgi:NAD(P)-dependent dehydrogenase (short-subunit alcohol dehydrogenase family)